jgi:hypothetical protein
MDFAAPSAGGIECDYIRDLREQVLDEGAQPRANRGLDRAGSRIESRTRPEAVSTCGCAGGAYFLQAEGEGAMRRTGDEG